MEERTITLTLKFVITFAKRSEKEIKAGYDQLETGKQAIKDGGIDRFEMSIYGSWGKLSNESVLSKSILATLILSENTPVTL